MLEPQKLLPMDHCRQNYHNLRSHRLAVKSLAGLVSSTRLAEFKTKRKRTLLCCRRTFDNMDHSSRPGAPI